MPLAEDKVVRFETGFLQGGGEMGALLRQTDWARTPVGATKTWPEGLRWAVSICLGSSFPIAIYWGADLVLLYNDAWSPILGAKHPSALGRPAREVWPEIWDTIGPLFQQVLTTGDATRSMDQLLAMRRHGYTEECYFDYTFSPIRGESGGVEGIFNAVLETTERVVGERRLRVMRELAGGTPQARTRESACRITAEVLSGALADVPFALIYLLSASGDGVSLAGSVGLDTGVLHGAGVEDIWPIGRVLRTGVSELVDNPEILLGALPGGPWPESPPCALVQPLSRAGDRPHGVLVAGISPQRPLDQDYRDFVDLVTSHLAQALTNAEAHEEERKRVEALAELDRAKTAFFSNVSHEFRTPLTLMLGPLEEMMSRGGLPAGVPELVEVTHRNGLRLQKLVNTLLDFSRIEAGRTRARFESVDLARWTAEIASTFRSTVERAGLTFIVDCPPLREPVSLDREMWEKVMLNLLSNAFKFTLEGSIAVRVREAGGMAKVSVQDTGGGIPASEIPRIFDRFHRVEGARGRTQEGTGIGLALASELIRLHGGGIEAQSVVGEGTIFTVTLPFGSEHRAISGSLEAATVPATPERPGEAFVAESAGWVPADRKPTGAPFNSAGRVLLADDNADMREYVARLLGQRFEVEAVADGNAALARALASPPDLVLSDVMMPGLDGFGLLRALREDPRTRATPVLLLSARAGEEARVEGLGTGANDYLVKPFTARELLARVSAHLEMARMRAQAAAREAELRAEAEAARDRAVEILESITDGFYTLDGDWRFTYVNPTAERLLKVGREELIGKHHGEVFLAFAGQDGESHYQRAARDRVPVEFEVLHEPWNRWFAVKAYPTGQRGISVLFRDISQAKSAELRLRESQERLQAIFDGTYECIGLLAADGKVLEANRAFLELAGNTRAGFVGRPFWDAPWFSATPDTAEAVRQSIQRAAGGEFVRFEATVYRPSGEGREFDLSFHPIRDNAGKVVLIVPEGREITDQKRAEGEVRRQWRIFDAALSHLTDQVCIFDLQRCLIYANPALLSWWRISLAQAIGKTSRELGYPAGIGERLDRQIQQVLETGRNLRDHLSLHVEGGGLREYDTIFVPVLGSGGEVQAVAGSTRDVTERRQLELRERERSARLLESARLESLGVMAGGIAHDFNNLLVGILGNASLLVEFARDNERRIAQGIVTAAERAADLTRQMLAYSGKGRFLIETLDLNGVIQENFALLRASVSRSVGLTLSLGRGPCMVEADRSQLHQLMANVMINASEAIGGAGEITIRTRKVERREAAFSAHLASVVPAGAYAVLEIEDNGAGMTDETMKKIFEPFFTTKFTGRGLGLAAVLGIVKGHEGDIEVESRPGSGSTFRIFLPLAALPDPPEESRGEGVILVVDDEEVVRETAKSVLERRGFRVLLANNGAEALEVLSREPAIGLVILDLTMPGINGEQALPFIRGSFPEIPILLSSGFDEKEVLRRFRDAGIAGVLQKPYTPQTIASKADEALRVAR